MDAATYSCNYTRFRLWNADDNVLYGDYVPSAYYNSICAPTWEFSIQADPGFGCQGIVKSANIILKGPAASVTTNKTESIAPYNSFGDSDAVGFVYDPNNPGYYKGNITGRDFVAGDYSIKASFYSKVNMKGDLVATLAANFTVYTNCCTGYFNDPAKTGGRRLYLGGDV